MQKKKEESRLAYKFLILQHASIKCILEQKYEELIHVTIYALTRSYAVLVNQELLLAFTARKNNWIKHQRLDLKNKQEMEKQKLIKMQKPTTLAIKDQVSVEVDEKLRQVAM